MAQNGMSLNVGGFGGVRNRQAPQFGTKSSYQNPSSSSAAAFSDGLTPTYTGDSMSPRSATGLFFWIGVGSVVGLFVLRYSLPN